MNGLARARFSNRSSLLFLSRPFLLLFTSPLQLQAWPKSNGGSTTLSEGTSGKTLTGGPRTGPYPGTYPTTGVTVKTVAQWNRSLYNKTYSEKSDRIPWLMRMRREYCRVNMWRAPVDFKPNIFESCPAKTLSRQSVESKWILWIML